MSITERDKTVMRLRHFKNKLFKDFSEETVQQYSGFTIPAMELSVEVQT